MIKIVKLKEEDKAGTNYIDQPLEKLNTLEFGVMKKYKEWDVKQQFEKIYEESIEIETEVIIEEFKTDKKRLLELTSEVFDICQAGFTMLKILENKYGIDIKAANKKHLKKLKNKGYIE